MIIFFLRQAFDILLGCLMIFFPSMYSRFRNKEMYNFYMIFQNCAYYFLTFQRLFVLVGKETKGKKMYVATQEWEVNYSIIQGICHALS